MTSTPKTFWIIFILSLAGMAVSGYAIKLHYSLDPSTFCNINDTFNCDVVNKSWASEIAGFPVATIGFIGYALLALGSGWLLLTKKLQALIWGAMALASAGGLGFALFLTGVEIFNLKTFCVVCLASQALILVITILVWRSPEARQGVRSWFFSGSSS
ncbi:MAG: vitamin K epoxide reductase family protein [Patescibacteria group bacterium]